ncbi:1608_t:CDS:2 [Dentiscutata erythropus]|uniref:Mediator of RNA polymerase II transcription subunit 18 n=1 Tax=Dentiscutata erythropus TaxID=1348616 RepID=A0A9N9NS43_9GLOM|nr:1608_t:CDS:2 [Dentiscutata erythropus]
MTAAHYECSLHGRISGNLKSRLFDRLVGICGTQPIPTFEHEIGFIPTTQTPEGPSRNDDVLLRLKSPINEKGPDKRQWQLCQLGHPETNRSYTVRPIFYSKFLNGDALKFMNVLGYKFAFEFAKKGNVFTYRDALKISITQIFTLEKLHDITSIKPFDNKDNFIVEILSCLTPKDGVENVCNTLKEFTGMLKGTLDLHHVEHLSLQNKINYS